MPSPAKTRDRALRCIPAVGGDAAPIPDGFGKVAFINIFGYAKSDTPHLSLLNNYYQLHFTAIIGTIKQFCFSQLFIKRLLKNGFF